MYDSNLCARWAFEEGNGNTTLEQVSDCVNRIEYIFNDARFKPPSDPLWRPGVRNGALLFDGFSTWIAHPQSQFNTPTDALTISVWIAPRSFEDAIGQQLSAIINQHVRVQNQGFILGVYRHGTWSLQLGTGQQWIEIWSPDDARLPVDRWSHIVATFDSGRGEMCLYLNGERIAQASIAAGSSIALADLDVLIGKNNNATQLGRMFEVNYFDGLMDELIIYDTAWDATDIRQHYEQVLSEHGGELPVPDTTPYRSRYAGDRHRPQYHFIAPQHWMNEPHALLHFRGKYHLTYQYNPRGPYWHHIHWGHTVSDDLVHWKDLPVAIAPQADSVAPDGIWSGSATVDGDGNPAIFFTAGNNAMSPNQMTGLARSTFIHDGDVELRNWTVHDSPVTLLSPDIRINGHPLLPAEFRDPFVWREGDIWCQLVGAGVEGVGGTALLYTSHDLVSWTYRGPILVGDSKRFPHLGMMWELPVFLPVGQGRHILLISPWWNRPSSHFLKYVPYWLGTWNPEELEFTPDHEEPRLFDYGEHFTGPSGAVDEHGRTIVFNIARAKRPSEDERDSGWAGNAGLPIMLFMHDDGELGLRPVPELEGLRGNQLLSLTESSLAHANDQLRDVHGTMLEIRLEMCVTGARRCGLKVRRTPDGAEETLIFYDTQRNTLSIDRQNASLDAQWYQKGVQGGPLRLGDDVLRLTIYLDQSMLEIYANERRSITSRVYPTRADATGLALWVSDGDVLVDRLEVWEMLSAY